MTHKTKIFIPKLISFLLTLVFITSLNAESPFKKGDRLPKITLPSIHSDSGDSISLNQLKGRIVLLDFWGTWCAPCRETNKELIAIYKKFHDKEFEDGVGFEIFSIAIDKDKKKIRTSIEEDGLPWKFHSSDYKMWNSEICQIFNLKYLPANILLDGNGKIIEMNVDAPSLSVILKRRLSE
jgi:thiol-disulfide isomerase/thioredoxin